MSEMPAGVRRPRGWRVALVASVAANTLFVGSSHLGRDPDLVGSPQGYGACVICGVIVLQLAAYDMAAWPEAYSLRRACRVMLGCLLASIPYLPVLFFRTGVVALGWPEDTWTVLAASSLWFSAAALKGWGIYTHARWCLGIGVLRCSAKTRSSTLRT